MVLTNRFKRLGSRPLSRSSRHPCLQYQYRRAAGACQDAILSRCVWTHRFANSASLCYNNRNKCSIGGNAVERTILHCDCNSFYASVETLLDPTLADGPTAVCGDPESRHGIILAKNE